MIRLEQNYRSTQNILDVANGVIRNNYGRKEKALWTKREQGEAVVFRHLQSAYEEAEYVVRDILKKQRTKKAAYRDFAVLYRTNYQSRFFDGQYSV